MKSVHSLYIREKKKKKKKIRRRGRGFCVVLGSRISLHAYMNIINHLCLILFVYLCLTVFLISIFFLSLALVDLLVFWDGHIIAFIHLVSFSLFLCFGSVKKRRQHLHIFTSSHLQRNVPISFTISYIHSILPVYTEANIYIYIL